MKVLLPFLFWIYLEFLSKRDSLAWCMTCSTFKHSSSSRREAFLTFASCPLLVIAGAPTKTLAVTDIVWDEISPISSSSSSSSSREDELFKVYNDQTNWTGTSLSLLSPSQAAHYTEPCYPMGRWPDPILRRPATSYPKDDIKKDPLLLTNICNKLRETARENGAVGLAAQQCGIDVSLIFLDDPQLLSLGSGSGSGGSGGDVKGG